MRTFDSELGLKSWVELLAVLKQAYCMIDAESKIVYANDAAKKSYVSVGGADAVTVFDLLPVSAHEEFSRWFAHQSLLAKGPPGDSRPDRGSTDRASTDKEWLRTRLRTAEDEDHFVELALTSTPDAGIFVLALREPVFSMIEHKKIDALRAEIGEALVKNEGLKSLLQDCTDAMVRHLDAALARIWIYDSSRELLVLQASAGPAENTREDFFRIPLGAFKVGRVGATRKFQILHNLLDDPEIVDKEWVKRESINSVAFLPLCVGEELVGVLSIFSRALISEALILELRTGCDYLAVVIESKNKDRLEKQLDALVQSAHEAITIRGLDGRIINWNKAAESIYGYSLSEALGMDYMVLVPPELEPEQRILNEELNRGAVTSFHQTVRLTKTGERIPVALTCFPVIDGFGDCFGSCAITTDLRDRKHREAQALQILLLQDREDYLYTLTHELKGPLLGVRRICEQLLKNEFGEIPKEPCEVLNKIRLGNEELISLIQNIIDVYRYERELGELEFLETDLLPLILQGISNISVLADLKHVEIELETTFYTLMLSADQRALRRVVENLLENAIKFSPLHSKVRIYVDSSFDNVIIVFENEGEQLSQSEQSHLFERFWQGARGKTYASGSGLGLYLCRKILNAHGGEISYQRVGSIGNRFRISLPLLKNA